VERSEGGFCKAGARACPKERYHRPPCHSESSGGRALCRADGPRRGVESRRPRGRVDLDTTTPPPNPNPSPLQVTEAPKQHKVTASRKTARPKKPEPKLQQPLSRLLGSPRRKQPRVSKNAAAKPTTHDLVVPTQRSTSPLEEISDLLDHLPIQACVELTRHVYLLPPTGAVNPRAVLKTVILFVAECGSTP
jgi:hypothetical protein